MARRKYPGTVAERLARKIEVLQSFVEGIPSGVEVPRTLNELAIWHDETLGLYPISSPNDISTKNPRFSNLVIKAQEEIDKLGAVGNGTKACRSDKGTAGGGRQKRPTLAEENAKLRDGLTRSAARESVLMGQFHMKDWEIDRMRRDIASKESQIRQLNEQNRLLTQRIHDLEEIRILHTSVSGHTLGGRPDTDGRSP
jgi:hypothetical protein